MYEEDKSAVDELTSILGSRYAVVLYISKCARSILRSVHNVISPGSAIQWALTGQVPDDIDSRLRIYSAQRLPRLPDSVQDIIASIDDRDIQEAVIRSYTASRYRGDITYDYLDISDEYKQARVRILTRMSLYA